MAPGELWAAWGPELGGLARQAELAVEEEEELSRCKKAVEPLEARRREVAER